MNSLKLAEHGFQPMFYPIDKNDCTCTTGKNCLAGMAGVWIQVEEVVEDGATDDDDNGDTETSTTVPNTYSNSNTNQNSAETVSYTHLTLPTICSV